MINLLPSQQKKELAEEKKYRLVLILGIIFSLSLISLFLTLSALEIYISGQVSSQKLLVELGEKEFRASDTQKLESEIGAVNQRLLDIESFYQNQFRAKAIIERVAKILPPGVYLTQFSLSLKPADKEKKREMQLSLSGFSPTREILYNFKKNIEKEKDFQNIYFPSSNWIKPADVDFSLIISLNPEQTK